MTRLSFLLTMALFVTACASKQVVPTSDVTPPPAEAGQAPEPEAEIPSEPVTEPTPVETDEDRALREAEEKERLEAEAKAAEEARRAEAEARDKAVQERLARTFDGVQSSVKAGRWEEAIGALEQALEEEPEAWAAHYNLGLLLERQGQRDKAIEQYKKALSFKPDYEQASANLTRLYIRSDQLRQAEAELRKRITDHPRNTAFRNQLVRVLIAQGGDRVKHAEAESKRVLKFDERNVDAMVNLGTIWFNEGKFELAKQVLDNAREIDPGNPAVWNLIAFTQLRLDMKPLALDSFRKAAELREDFPEAHNNLGAMLNEVNDCDGAIRELELAVKYAPDWAQARLNLGNAYRCARQYEKAQKEYETALALDAKDGAGQSSDPWFNLAILYLDGDIPEVEKLERLKQSVVYFEKYQAAGGDDPRTGRYLEEAKKNIDKEAKRLERVAEQERKAAERKQQEEAKRRAEEEKQRALQAARQAEIERLKVAGKSDIVDEAPTPAPAPAPPPRLQKVPKEDI